MNPEISLLVLHFWISRNSTSCVISWGSWMSANPIQIFSANFRFWRIYRRLAAFSHTSIAHRVGFLLSFSISLASALYILRAVVVPLSIIFLQCKRVRNAYNYFAIVYSGECILQIFSLHIYSYKYFHLLLWNENSTHFSFSLEPFELYSSHISSFLCIIQEF
jgi:hypothetical protein